MRASSSWIKLQFVVRKHVMNTYQMHTLSPSFYSITLSLPISPSLFHVFDFFCLSDSTSCHSLSGFLMLCPTEVTYSVVLYNVLLYMCMCRLCAHAHFLIFRVCNMCTLLCVSSYFIATCLRQLLCVVENGLQTCSSALTLHFMVSLTL